MIRLISYILIFGICAMLIYLSGDNTLQLYNRAMRGKIVSFKMKRMRFDVSKSEVQDFLEQNNMK